MAEAVMIIEKPLIDPTELLQNSIIDFDIMRGQPMLFRAGGNIICCHPVSYLEHKKFLSDIAFLMINYSDIFHKVEFLSMLNIENDSLIKKAINQMNIFTATKTYGKFIEYELPRFIKKWCSTIDKRFFRKPKMKRIKTNRKVKKLLKGYAADELIQIFFTMFVYNFDVVKKNMYDFTKRLQHPKNSDKQTTNISNSTTKKVFQMPKYSDKAFSNETWELLDSMKTQ